MIYFVLWMVLYPLACVVESLVYTIREVKYRNKQIKDSTFGISGLINLAIYVYIAMLIWKNI